MSFVGCGFWVFMPNENHITIPMKKLTETVLSTYSQLPKKNLVNKQKNQEKWTVKGPREGAMRD